MKLRFVCVIFFTCVFYSLSFCQLTWVDGYVVTNPGDTLYGKIKFTTPAQRSAKIIFEGKGTDEKIKYKPFQIKGFFMDKRVYESKIYDFDPSLTYGFGVFMERMNIGTVQVYQYWNTDKERGFTQTFIENDGDYLLEIDYLNFKKQMTRYFEEFPQLQSKIKRGEFRKRDLMAMVSEFNEWKSNEW